MAKSSLLEYTSWNKRDQEVLLALGTNKIDFCLVSESKKKGKVVLDAVNINYFVVELMKISRRKQA